MSRNELSKAPITNSLGAELSAQASLAASIRRGGGAEWSGRLDQVGTVSDA